MKVKDYTRAFMQKIKAAVIPTTPYEVYSTSEIQVGVLNGKPLYRKIVNVGNFPNATTKKVEHGLSNIEDIITCKLIGKTSTSYSESNYNGAGIRSCYTDKSYVYIVTNSNQSEVVGYVILDYTKTTDTANSPKVPTQALVEYSTNEKLVGYWIDGKAIYEKTVSIAPLPTASATKEVAHGISNLGEIISISGFARNPSTNVRIPLPFASSGVSGISVAVVNNTSIQVAPGTDRSSFTIAYVTLRYTNTS